MRRATAILATLLVVLGPGAATALAAHTVRVDVSSSGVLAGTEPDSSGIAMSADGRLVAFSSGAPNLVAGDTNGTRDVFVRDTRTTVTTRVSLGAGGVQGNGDSFGPLALSGDGRFVAFESDSSNLAAGSACSPGAGPFCVFVRDRTAGTTRLVRQIVNPIAVGLSEHGRYLVASSIVGPLVRIDLHTGGRVLVSCCGLGADFKEALSYGGMSANANKVSFGINTGPGGAGLLQVYVRNIARSKTTLVSRAAAKVPGDDESFAGGISPGGRYVIFTSRSANLVPGDTNHRADVFVRDLRRGTIHRVDVVRRHQANGSSRAIGISAGGRFRVFVSAATNLVRSDTNHAWDIFVRDRLTGRVLRADRSAVQANRGIGRRLPGAVAMSAGAGYVAFVSPSTNLVPAGANTLTHVYMRGRLF